jgi:hypothetical protein
MPMSVVSDMNALPVSLELVVIIPHGMFTLKDVDVAPDKTTQSKPAPFRPFNVDSPVPITCTMLPVENVIPDPVNVIVCVEVTQLVAVIVKTAFGLRVRHVEAPWQDTLEVYAATILPPLGAPVVPGAFTTCSA